MENANASYLLKIPICSVLLIITDKLGCTDGMLYLLKNLNKHKMGQNLNLKLIKVKYLFIFSMKEWYKYILE